MAQHELVELMARLASEGCSLPSSDAISCLAEMLDRLRPTLDNADYETLLLIGASIWRCIPIEQSLNAPDLGSGGTG
jgi:hypothetical protein